MLVADKLLARCHWAQEWDGFHSETRCVREVWAGFRTPCAAQVIAVCRAYKLARYNCLKKKWQQNWEFEPSLVTAVSGLLLYELEVWTCYVYASLTFRKCWVSTLRVTSIRENGPMKTIEAKMLEVSQLFQNKVLSTELYWRLRYLSILSWTSAFLLWAFCIFSLFIYKIYAVNINISVFI